MDKLVFVYDDGGRKDSGFKGSAGDCVCRAIAIATGLPYREVYDRLADGNVHQRKSKYNRKKSNRTARDGIFVRRKWFKDYMRDLGFEWVATMGIGTGCRVHLRADELPSGRLVVSVSRHLVAVIDGVLYDTNDCSREGTRCVYGYWKLKEWRNDAP